MLGGTEILEVNMSFTMKMHTVHVYTQCLLRVDGSILAGDGSILAGVLTLCPSLHIPPTQ